MLRSEYLAALSAVIPRRPLDTDAEHDARIVTCAWTYPLACALYRCRRIDAVAVGPNRHLAFVRWMHSHTALAFRFQRFVNRRPKAELARLRAEIYAKEWQAARLEEAMA